MKKLISLLFILFGLTFLYFILYSSGNIVSFIGTAQAYEDSDFYNADAQIYKDAGEKFGYPWQIISAVHFIETGYSRRKFSSDSYKNAKGCMQFLPSTWNGNWFWNNSEKKYKQAKGFGVDGDNDGIADIYNCSDAIYSAGNYLKHGLKGGNYWASIFNYNHSNKYVAKVWREALNLGWTY